MDFEEYIKRMKATLEKMEASGQEDISYIISGDNFNESGDLKAKI